MSRKIKLIWDFRGSESVLKVAQDHAENIRYYVTKEKSNNYHEIGAEAVSDFHALAFLIIDEQDMLLYRDVLKPHRAVVAQ